MANNPQSDTNRIAKNTLFLYFRTILIMVVSLYTSRVVLNTLGVEDFGVYNAVGGVVAMFAVISGALTNAISRYITYEIGKGNVERQKIVFSTSVNIQLLISIVIFVLCEIGGLWFLNYKMNIPSDRLYAANWVLHYSLLTFVVNLISVPYNACIIAHEHMNAYAYISIIDAVLKLSVVFLLVLSPVDKLIAYAVLLLLTSLIIRILYGIYCSKHFEETKYSLQHDKKLFKEMLGFAGWNFMGNATSILNYHGISLLMNVFFGVIVNTARGIAAQVESAVTVFVNTFTTAVNPQITKSYATGDYNRVYYLVCKGAKFSYLLLLLFAAPLILETEQILTLWLGDVPDHAVTFTRLAIVGSMVTVLGNTGYNACLATGNIKKYSIWITFVGCFAFFGAWAAFALGMPVEYAYYSYITVYIVVQIVRLMLMKTMIGFPVNIFVKDVVLRLAAPTIFAFSLSYVCMCYMQQGLIRLVITTILCEIMIIVCSIFFSLTKGERFAIYNKIMSTRRNES